MEELNLDALRALLRYLPRSWEEEQAIRDGRMCGDCGGPICAGIASLHRHCPARQPRPILVASRSHARKRDKSRYVR
jgi:hypothetical protein